MPILALMNDWMSVAIFAYSAFKAPTRDSWIESMLGRLWKTRAVVNEFLTPEQLSAGLAAEMAVFVQNRRNRNTSYG